MRRIPQIVSVSALLLTAVAFQNFSSLNSADVQMTSTSGAGPGPSSPDYPADDVYRDPYTPSQLPTFNCVNVIELASPNGTTPVQIPPRDPSGSGTCYSMKLISAYSSSPSSNNPNTDPQVTSRNHDSPANLTIPTHHPYAMGSAVVGLYLQGERSLKLAGGPTATANIMVDNFILVGLAPVAQLDNPYYYLAYGTSDSSIPGTTSVVFNNQNVQVTPYAVGGTSQVPPISLDNKISSQVNYVLDVRALDCGGVGLVSDVYILFQ